MFYGSGAGKLPTASAVVADVIDAAKHQDVNVMVGWSNSKLELGDIRDLSSRFFVRMKGSFTESLPESKKFSEMWMRKFWRR